MQPLVLHRPAQITGKVAVGSYVNRIPVLALGAGPQAEALMVLGGKHHVPGT